MIMKKTLKTAQERAKDRKDIRELTKQLHAEAFELVQEFKEEWHCHGDITQLSVGLVSRMLNVNSHALELAKLRGKQDYKGEKFTADTTWEGHYDEK